MGAGLAAAIVPCCDCVGDAVVSGGQFRLRINCRSRCACAFGLNLLTPRLATLVRTDMPLALVIFLIGLLIWKKIQRQHEWNVRDRVYLFALLTVSMLIKGPIVYAFLLPGILCFSCGVGTASEP